MQKERVVRMMSAPCFMTVEDKESITYAATLPPLSSRTGAQLCTTKSKVVIRLIYPLVRSNISTKPTKLL